MELHTLEVREHGLAKEDRRLERLVKKALWRKESGMGAVEVPNERLLDILLSAFQETYHILEGLPEGGLFEGVKLYEHLDKGDAIGCLRDCWNSVYHSLD